MDIARHVEVTRHDVGRLPVVERSAPDRAVGYLGRAGILTARQRHHEAEEVREKGPFALSGIGNS